MRVQQGIVVGCIAALTALSAFGCGGGRKVIVEQAAQPDNSALRAAEEAREKAEEEARKKAAEEAARKKVEEEARRKAAEAKPVGLTFMDIHFNFDKYNIRPDATEILVGHSKTLQAHPQVKIVIEGHCDERGTIEYNLALGDRRARSAKAFLVNYGIALDRLSTVSYGEEQPLDPGHNEEAWAKNRRAAFVILQQATSAR